MRTKLGRVTLVMLSSSSKPASLADKRFGRDGVPALLGNLGISRTGENVSIKTGHGVAGRISSKKLDLGYRYTVPNPDGQTTGAHIGATMVGDTITEADVRLFAGGGPLRPMV